MAPHSDLAGDVCVEETMPTPQLDATVDVTAPTTSITKSDEKGNGVVLFFDWDDTIMASTAVAQRGLCPKFVNEKPDIPSDVSAALADLEDSVLLLLEKALSYGRVVIVTAAEAGWVELSASLFMPRVVPMLHTQLKVVSARTTYEGAHPDSPRQWKIEAFNHEVFPSSSDSETDITADIDTVVPRHVISLGDGPTEREALINVKMQALDACHGKSMKFIAHPQIHELKLEVELMLANLDHLCTHEGDLDLQITWDMLANGAC